MIQIRTRRAELIEEITEAGHILPQGRNRKKDIVEFAMKYDILVKKSVVKGVTETWVGAPKGMLQVAFERGLLDLEKYCVGDFSSKGLENEMGNRIENTRLESLLASCSDFIGEESQL